jgi:uncharacterized protein YqjF (DUF2071 family)
MHWPAPAAGLVPFVPASLQIDEHEGTSWIGLVPFEMRDVALRGTPALPWLSTFPEMNLRLYVRHRGRAGVWFVSLDAARLIAVRMARRLAHLPYFLARMQMWVNAPRVTYRSVRAGRDDVAFDATYWPIGSETEASKGSLEGFLTERYALFSQDARGRLWTVDIHHLPWLLQPAAAEIRLNTVATAQGLPPTSERPLLHFSRRQDVATWAPRLVGGAGNVASLIG